MNITTNVSANIKSQSIQFAISKDMQDAYLEVNFTFDATGEEYLFMPSCAYDGNRFDVYKKNYPPMFDLHEAKIDMPVVITDIPRLEKDGSGIIEVTTGDLSVPCVGLFDEKNKKGILLFTSQGIDKNFGLAYHAGNIAITYPHRRKLMYRSCRLIPSTDKGIDFIQGQIIEIPYKLFEFSCENLQDFFRIFFEKRKCMGLDTTYGIYPDTAHMWKIQEDKYNEFNYRPAGGYYGVGSLDSKYQDWQLGWVGGGMSSYALLKNGGEISRWRAIQTLKHVFKTQTACGFFVPIYYQKEGMYGDDFQGQFHNKLLLTRRIGDILYFLFKHFSIMEHVPQAFIDGTKRVADAVVRLYHTYNQFGQFINMETGEMIVGGSTSAGIMPAGLVSAYRFFHDETYLDIAKKSAEQFYERDVQKGYTTGGPCEILQCPDSESAFGLLESFVALYDETKEEKYLNMARHMAHLCSSWVVAYNYKFPTHSEFSRLDMKTIGTVWASVQNKHSAPGICTLSAQSLQKLYEWTGDVQYQEMMMDISKNIAQYLSTDERPIYSWDNQPQKLEKGVMCERVNMSDWESEAKIGGVFNVGCWCELSNMLTMAELDLC